MVLKLFQEIIATYHRHGWQLRRVLLQPETHAAVDAQAEELFDSAVMSDAEFDALWFARPSHAGREAWELRLVAEQAYALFETFEPDEAEDAREDRRREIEASMREHVTTCNVSADS